MTLTVRGVKRGFKRMRDMEKSNERKIEGKKENKMY